MKGRMYGKTEKGNVRIGGGDLGSRRKVGKYEKCEAEEKNASSNRKVEMQRRYRLQTNQIALIKERIKNVGEAHKYG